MDSSTLTQALDDFVPQILELCQAPGISIAIGVGDSVAVARAYGYADVDEQWPMTPDTVGPTGSDCKAYTGVAILQLVECGLIGLDDPINDHLIDLKVTNPHGKRAITLRDLLTHRSGLGTGFGNCDRVPPAPLGDHLRRVSRRSARIRTAASCCLSGRPQLV